MPRENTKALILEVAGELLASGGISAVSFDAIATRLGRSKQAVLYWYPNKHALLGAMFLPALKAEAETATAALAHCETEAEAIAAFVSSILRFHMGDLDRFRMMYLLPQTQRHAGGEPPAGALLDEVHPVTDAMYAALAARLGGDPISARQKAFAIHSAVLGVALMFGLADSLGDPLKHGAEEAARALIESFGASL
ncbi:TetR/AcrR family transcriptional regulator [Pseudoruegeria sp. SHC-113]|uniref:TetR/AcrR family transcriptional regulator n=1 Tax=Pseudoruegeria sp. SHC-113 TaxID=2855439 RepID=UPI0021BAC0CC|nr:helix-turn-helix domain-containing protein [Pseudoruegeria sp. SHC-113]MCT8158982.1 TetR/AcrR family transcriptional regulator [Pseudoruegeria sp. SHC-113]